MSDRKRLHLVPQFHYDIEYLLPLEPYLEVCFENLLEARRLLGEHPDYTFLVEQVFLLEQFLREYPALAADFRRFATEGRLDIAPGAYAMADQNMPSGESLLRQMTVGREWCEERLGVSPAVYNAGDCTGAGAQFPQMLRHCGYDYYVFMRAVDDVSRASEIRWTGLDGTELRTCWLPAGYAGWVPPVFTAIPPGEGRGTTPDAAVATATEHALSDDVLLPHGGDFVHPYAGTPALLEAWNREHPDLQIRFSTYSRALPLMDWANAPGYEGEWNPDRAGCYSSRIRIKQENRACEALLRTAETLCAVTEMQQGILPDHDGLLRAWKLTFVNQFHDTLWGTVCDEAHRRALNRAKRVRMITQRLIESRLNTFVAENSEAPGHRRITVFNPLPWPRTVDLPIPRDGQALGLATDMANVDVPTLWRRVELPAVGVRTLTVDPLDTPHEPAAPTAFTARPEADGGLTVETPLYRVRFTASGAISSLLRLRDSLEVVDLERPWSNVLCAQCDRGDLWQYHEGPVMDGGEQRLAADLPDDPYPLEPTYTRNGRRILGWAHDNRETGQAAFEVAECSAERLVLHVRGELGAAWPRFREFERRGLHIEWEQRLLFRNDDPQIDIRLSTHHCRGRWYRLRAAFFTGIRGGRAIHEIPFGRWDRPEGEFAAQNFVALCDEHRGLAVLNRGLPGNSVTDGVLMLSLMRSVNIDTRVDSDDALEEGTRHTFDYAILPFAGIPELEDLALARRGLDFVTPPYVYERHPKQVVTATASDADFRGSLLDVQPSAIVCTAVFPVADGLAVRLYESEGLATTAELRPGFQVGSACETDALLRSPQPLAIEEGRVRVNFRPFEIRTVVLSTEG